MILGAKDGPLAFRIFRYIMNLMDKSIPISSEERDLIFQIIQGHDVANHNQKALVFIHMFRTIAIKSKYVPYMDILRWLIKQKLVGQMFVHWMQEKHEDSPVNAVSYIRQQIFSDWKKRSVLARRPMV